jgi:ubiquinone/menaquinone biosynthesis C-methylase UbiE
LKIDYLTDWKPGAKKNQICAQFVYDSSQRVLDLGCSKRQAQNYCKGEYIGFDIQATSTAEGPDVLGDAQFLPFQSESFDIILAFDVIEHLANGDSFISECYRLLKPNGKTLIVTPNGPKSEFANADPTHINIYTGKRLKSELEAHDFKVVPKNHLYIHSRVLSILTLFPQALGNYIASKFVSEMFLIALKTSQDSQIKKGKLNSSLE